MIADRQTDRQTDTLITILRAIGGGLISNDLIQRYVTTNGHISTSVFDNDNAFINDTVKIK